MTIFEYMREYGNNGTALLEMCRSLESVRKLIPDGFEPVLPRFRVEDVDIMTRGKPSTRRERTAEYWWSSTETGVLRYYVALDLPATEIREFRELPGDVIAPGMQCTDAEMAYLDQAAALWNPIPKPGEKAYPLDELWQSLVPDNLRDYALQKREERTINSYLLPVESLTCWSWEKLRDMLLKRENTTVEEILDFIQYKKSGSSKLYISPKDREQAKKNGMKFWGG